MILVNILLRVCPTGDYLDWLLCSFRLSQSFIEYIFLFWMKGILSISVAFLPLSWNHILLRSPDSFQQWVVFGNQAMHAYVLTAIVVSLISGPHKDISSVFISPCTHRKPQVSIDNFNPNPTPWDIFSFIFKFCFFFCICNLLF